MINRKIFCKSGPRTIPTSNPNHNHITYLPLPAKQLLGYFTSCQLNIHFVSGSLAITARNCNPRPVFRILGLRIKDFVIPGSRWDYGILPRIYGIYHYKTYKAGKNDFILDLQLKIVKKGTHLL